MFLFLSLAFLSPQLLVPGGHVEAQQASVPPPAPPANTIHLKHVLVVGQTKGFEHDSVSAAMATIYDMGKESGLWDTLIRTDTELLTKKDLKRNTKNLTDSNVEDSSFGGFLSTQYAFGTSIQSGAAGGAYPQGLGNRNVQLTGKISF